jgi:hypothetical protein
MSLANYDEIFLICCDWESVSIRPEAVKLEKLIKGLDLIPSITVHSWESGAAEIPSEQEIREVVVLL